MLATSFILVSASELQLHASISISILALVWVSFAVA